MLNLNDRSEGVRLSARKSIPGRENSQLTGPEVDPNLVCLRNKELGLYSTTHEE